GDPPSLIDTVRRHVSRVLGEDRVISVTEPLNQLGLDSLLAVTLANRLRDALKVAVPTAMLLKGYSIADLVAELFPAAAPPPLAGAVSASPSRAGVLPLSARGGSISIPALSWWPSSRPGAKPASTSRRSATSRRSVASWCRGCCLSSTRPSRSRDT